MSKGNWRRVACWLWGHEYIGAYQWLHRHPITTCQRCFVTWKVTDHA